MIYVIFVYQIQNDMNTIIKTGLFILLTTLVSSCHSKNYKVLISLPTLTDTTVSFQAQDLFIKEVLSDHKAILAFSRKTTDIRYLNSFHFNRTRGNF